MNKINIICMVSIYVTTLVVTDKPLLATTNNVNTNSDLFAMTFYFIYLFIYFYEKTEKTFIQETLEEITS